MVIPIFGQQLDQLKQYQNFGGDKPLPGTSQSGDRFIREAYYQKSLPKPFTRETIAGVLSIARNVSQPFGISNPFQPNIPTTRWRTVSDLTNKLYYFEPMTSPNIIWVHLNKLHFTK
jgi:penicillin V acylase-like amidase (Ntn superfamily)